MNDNFKCIYRILMAFEKSLDITEFDIAEISAERLGVSETRRVKYLEMLVHAGYITGLEFRENIAGGIDIIAENPLITVKGLEYFSENTIMQRLYKLAKGIKDVLPE